jgi:hypothetical protein
MAGPNNQHNFSLIIEMMPPEIPSSDSPAEARRQSRLRTETPCSDECRECAPYWADLEYQHRHANCCRSSKERELLTIIAEKIHQGVGSCYSGNWKNYDQFKDYGSAACIIACSGYPGDEDFVQCGYASYSCGRTSFCPRCAANRLALPLLDEFGNSISAGNDVFYAVLSFSSDPREDRRFIFKDLSVPQPGQNAPAPDDNPIGSNYGIEFETFADLRDARIIFTIIIDAIREFTGNRRDCLFNGAIGGPELSVRFGPLRALPHGNFIIWSSGFSADGARKLRRYIRDKMRNCRLLQTKLFPSIACYRLKSAEDLRRVINYICKPIDFVSAYKNAASAGCTPVELAQLNRETSCFLKNADKVFWHLRRVSRYGRCSPAHHDYIGLITDRRRAQREYAAQKRLQHRRKPESRSKLHPVERWEMHYCDEVERLFSRRHSKFQHWQQRIERPPVWPPSALSVQPHKLAEAQTPTGTDPGSANQIS